MSDLHPEFAIDEIWTLRINPSDLSNIERPIGVGPTSGGGQLYIQIGKSRVEDTLAFLRIDYPEGAPVDVPVRCQGDKMGRIDTVEFSSKSQGRMRITNQNRHRAKRVFAWSPSLGFPQLPAPASTEAAKSLIDSLGGLHIWIARDEHGEQWAGYTTGSTAPPDVAKQPFAHLLYGDSPGGVWKYQEGDDS